MLVMQMNLHENFDSSNRLLINKISATVSSSKLEVDSNAK